MARASIKTGVLAAIYLGANKVLGASEYSLSGMSAGSLAADEFGYPVNKKVWDGTIDPGTLSVPNVLKDPDDSTGQALLDAACAAGTEYGPDEIKFMRDATSYYTPGTGGTVRVTKAGSGGLKRNGLEMTSYEFEVSGALLVIRPSLTSIAVTITGGGALTVAVGATAQLIATGTYSDNSTAVLTSKVVWASADETKIIVTAGGLVAGISADAGTDITATLLGIVGTGSVATTAP